MITSLTERLRQQNSTATFRQMREREDDASYRIIHAPTLKANAEARRRLEELADLRRACE